MRGASLSEDARRYFPVSWEEMHRDARALSWRLATHAPWQGIVAIARGGLGQRNRPPQGGGRHEGDPAHQHRRGDQRLGIRVHQRLTA